MVHIADTGFLVALNDKNKETRKRTRELFASIRAPMFTCEAVLTEAAHLVSPELIARMVRDGDLQVEFSLQLQISRLAELLEKYSPRMDLADACVVRMTELFTQSIVYTVDRDDFAIYRRHGDKPLSCVFVG